MGHPLDASIVRIFGADDSIAGCGFLVSKSHLLTCAHVVAQALHIPQDTEEMPTATIRLDFPLIAPKAINTARVVFWKPVRSVVSTPPDRSEDIATLELMGDLPDGSRPCPVISLDDLWEHSFRTFGFPVAHDDGVWASGLLRAAQTNGWVQIEDVKNTGYFVAPGFSGTPVWDNDAKGVVGMVVVAEKRSEVRAAFMIPTEILIKAWPILQAEIAHTKKLGGSAEQRVSQARYRVGGKRIKAATYFRGRWLEQKKLGEYLARSSARVVSVTGRAGIGKTALASKVLNDLEQGRWPHTEDEMPVDGIVYMSTRSLTGISLAQLLLDCGEMLGGEHQQTLVDISNSGSKVEAKIQLLLEKLESGRYVILLDHVEDLLERGSFKDEELKTFFESSLDSANGLRLVVTSRDPLKFPPDFLAYDLEVPLPEGLPIEDGIALLRELDPTGKSRLRDADEEQLARAVKRLHRVPRALEVLAGIMKEKRLTTLDKILDRFYQQPDVVNLLIKEGYNMLDTPARDVMKALAVFDCPVPPSAVSYLLKPFAPDIDAESVLERLLSIYMAKASPDGETVWLDAIDQEYAYYELPEQGEFSRLALERLAADYYKDRRKPRESWRTIEDVVPHLREFEHRLEARDYEAAAETLSQVDVDFLIWSGHALRALELRNKLEGNLNESRSRMFHAYALGNIREVLGPFNEAIGFFEDAQKIARDIGDRVIECHTAGSLGETYRRLGQLDKAIENHRKAQEIARDLNDVKLESTHLLSFGLSCIYHGDIKAGIEHSKRLIEISRASNLLSEAQAYDCYSLAYLTVGRLDETIAYSDKAIDIYEKVNNRNGSMYVRNVRGMAQIGLNQLTEAVETLKGAQKMADEADYPRLEGFCFFNLACAYRERGEMDNALEAANEALQLLSKLQAAENVAAAALVESIRAAIAGRRLDEARALLDCARCSITAPDIYDSDYFAQQAHKIAQSDGWADIIAEADRLIDEKQRSLILPD
jgi:tetratricopeptide (TPR) repeat protein